MEINSLGLVPVDHFGDGNPAHEARPTIVFKVTGLPSDHSCDIVFAGTGASGQRTWAIQWSRSREKVTVPAVFYDSQEEALAVIERMLREFA